GEISPAQRKPRPIFIYPGGDPAVSTKSGDPNQPSALLLGNAVFDGVFGDRLKYQTGDSSGAEFLGGAHSQLGAVRQWHLLNVQILLQELDFLSKWDLVAVGSVHHLA